MANDPVIAFGEAKTPNDALAHELRLLLDAGYSVNISKSRTGIDLTVDGPDGSVCSTGFGPDPVTAIAMELNVMRRALLKQEHEVQRTRLDPDGKWEVENADGTKTEGRLE